MRRRHRHQTNNLLAPLIGVIAGLVLLAAASAAFVPALTPTAAPAAPPSAVAPTVTPVAATAARATAVAAIPSATPVAADAVTGDRREQPVVMTQLPFTDVVDTSTATSAASDPSCSGDGHSVWYRYTATRDATVSIDTYGSDYDTTLGVYTGDGKRLACADDTRGVQAAVRLDVHAGTVYEVMVAACCGRPGGTLLLHANEADPGPAIAVAVHPTMQRAPGSVRATVSGTVTCSRPSSVQLEVRMRPPGGGPAETGYGAASCDGTAEWAVPVVPGGTVDAPVPVTVTALSCDASGGCRVDEVSSKIQLVH